MASTRHTQYPLLLRLLFLFRMLNIRCFLLRQQGFVLAVQENEALSFNNKRVVNKPLALRYIGWAQEVGLPDWLTRVGWC